MSDYDAGHRGDFRAPGGNSNAFNQGKADRAQTDSFYAGLRNDAHTAPNSIYPSTISHSSTPLYDFAALSPVKRLIISGIVFAVILIFALWLSSAKFWIVQSLAGLIGIFFLIPAAWQIIKALRDMLVQRNRSH